MPLDCSPEPSQLSFSTVQSYDQCKYFPRRFEKSENTLKFAPQNPKDIIATVTALTAKTIADSYERFIYAGRLV